MGLKKIECQGRIILKVESLSMYTSLISFKSNNESDAEGQAEAVSALLSAWLMNGQILGDQLPTAKGSSGYSVCINTPEPDSISEKYQSEYVKKYSKELLDVGLCDPELTILGQEPDSVEACACKDTDFYILYTTYAALETPLRCGGCFGVVPLYKLPKTGDDDYHGVIGWQSDYQSCDTLQMNGVVGERFASNQMSNIDTHLSCSGIEVCEKISKNSGKPVYYYLYKWAAKSRAVELTRKCPKCHGDWYRDEPLHNMFDFMCEQCNLVSNIAWDVR